MTTNEHLRPALEAAQTVGPGRFACIGDLRCDIEGGLEFLPRHSTLGGLLFATRLRTSRPWLSTSSPRCSRATSHSTSPTCSSCACARAYTAFATRLRGTTRSGRWRWRWSARRLRRGRVTGGAPKWTAWSAVGQVESNQRKTADVPQEKSVLMLGSGMVAGLAVDMVAGHSDVELVVGAYFLSKCIFRSRF